jgi:putative ABC transport system permease protein
VIFSLSLIWVFLGIFGSQVPQITAEVSAGYDIIVESNQGNPVTVEQLEAQPGVVDAVALTRSQALATTPKRPEGTTVGLTGFDERFLSRGQPALDERDPAYATDADAFRAVLADPTLIIVNQRFGSAAQGGGPPQANLVIGDTITLTNTATDDVRSLKVVGIMASDVVGNGGMVSSSFVDGLLAPRLVQNRHYVKVADGADPAQVAGRISGALVANGADAKSFATVVADQLATQQAFFSLLRGYLGLGLLIGIAGLGVVMVRAVRERRRQIGMLRALGFSSAIVRRSFVLEAAFVALQGILLGIVLGMVTAYNLLVNSSAFGDQPLDFSWPWSALALIAVVPLVASLLATAWPATQAARIKPAVALRIAD